MTSEVCPYTTEQTKIKNKVIVVFMRQIYYFCINLTKILKQTHMNEKLITMLKLSAESDKAKALLTLDLLGNRAVGIGDHSTKDFYSNAEEALQMLVDAEDRLKVIEKYFGGK
jgi:hypothetical protein